MQSALRLTIAGVVTVIWTATYGRYIVQGAGAAPPPPELSGIMLAVVTWALGADLRDTWRTKRDVERRDDGRD